MLRVDRDTLSAVAQAELSVSSACAAVNALGWLAPWWLRREVIERAARRQPAYRAYLQPLRLPCDPGGCWAIFVAQAASSLLRPAYLLPLRWQRGADDPLLPRPLRQLAEQIRGQFQGAGWGLTLAKPDREEAVDLSLLQDSMGTDSAWASLVGGLLLARDGLSADAHVWASVAWNADYGIGSVAGVPAKLDLAAEWNVREIFVPAQNQPDVTKWREGHPQASLKISLLSPLSLNNSGSSPGRVLEAYLDLLRVEPSADQSLELKKRFYTQVGRSRALDFYWKQLLAEAVKNCRTSLPPNCQPTHLVTVVGLEQSIVAMAALTLRVKHCLLLCTNPEDNRLAKCMKQVRERLEAENIQCVVQQITSENRQEELAMIDQAVRSFAENVPPDKLACDLTPGFKSLTLALQAIAPRGCWLMYCRHEQQGADNRVKPGTERYDCWQKDG